MKKNNLLLLSLFSVLLFISCATKYTDNKTSLYGHTWELEYISGPRIAFEGLYPEKKPFIIFEKAETRFNGNTSCNGYSGKFKKEDYSIQFGDIIKTMIYCEGGGEETFLKMLGKVNKYALDSDGKLLLLIDDVPMMRFKKIAKPQQ